MSDTMQDKLAGLEAILYAYGRPMSLTELCAHLKLSSEHEVSILLNRLVEEYEKNGSALEIKELPEGRVVLQLKAEYSSQVRRLASKPSLTVGPLKTLSFISYNQPIEQKKIVEARGSLAYKHLKLLQEMGLISKQKKGRTIIITTTPEFSDYLGLSKDRSSMKRQLQKIFKSLELRQLEKKQ
ncbi:MAG: SMC-Scp complex subunit ScpB [Candidatus Bathyarchaeia archaeon]